MAKAFIFDLDGTVLDTLDDLGNACNLALKAFNYPTHPLPAYKQMVGNGFTLLIMRALPRGFAETLQPKEFSPILDFAAKAYAEHMMERTKPYAGIPEALAFLAAHNAPLAILSNKPEAMTKALINHYFPDIPFVSILGGREDMPLKPDPTRALTLLELFQCNADEVAFVGDSLVDMQTAINAGMEPTGVSWGFRDVEELRVNGALRIVHDPRQLQDLYAE